MGSVSNSFPEPIAVVGIGCRFPGGANTPSRLWDLLCSKSDLQQRILKSRFNIDGFHDSDGERPGCTNAEHAYLLDEDIREWDAAFFRTNPREAEAMDPQQRILLETVFESLESAGIPMEQLDGSSTSVYVGCMTGDYQEMMIRDPEDMPKYMATGTARSILSNRVSYYFNWKGPSITIDTACSSSLVAVHQAVHDLRGGVSKVACAAGANLIIGPEMMISESKLHMLSPTGRSRMWDVDADGYARGEGFAAVILKTLSHAIENGDYIHSIIRETGVNSDGTTNGITMPGAESQIALIKQTYRNAGLEPSPENCQFFEAHGTGTPAGDPIEASAIFNSFFRGRDVGGDANMYVGSVKTCIGHLEGSAGLAGLIKACEAVRRGEIPPNMLFKKLNPKLEPFYGPLQIPTEALAWPSLAAGSPRRASVNSFGFGGTNAHAIVESFENEHLTRARATETTDAVATTTIATPFVLSANSETALQEKVKSLLTLVESSVGKDISVEDILYTLQDRRSQHAVRAFVSGRDVENLSSKLAEATINPNDVLPVVRTEKNPASPKILGVFTGQGAQWPTMARELYKCSWFVRDRILFLDSALQSLPDSPEWSLVDQILADASSSRLSEAALAQPVCTAIQIILVDLLDRAGIHFDTVLGHSSGEISAAYAAGYLTAKDAIRISYYRGVHAKLARGPSGQKGAMMAAGLSFDDAIVFLAESGLEGRVDLAAHNAPSTVTLSGDKDAIGEAKKLLDEKQTFARQLLVDTAYHSHHMKPCAEPYLGSLKACTLEPLQGNSTCTWYSSVIRAKIGKEHVGLLAGEYWQNNMVNAVLFHDAVKMAADSSSCNVALEVGPHPALKGPFTQTFQDVAGKKLPYQGTVMRKKHDVEAMSDALGFIWSHLGSNAVQFGKYAGAFVEGKASRGLPVPSMPTYPWDHSQKFWKESRKSYNFRTRAPRHPLLGVRSTEDINDHDFRWFNNLRVEDLPWLGGHQIERQVIFPAAGYLVMAMESCSVLSGGKGIKMIELHDVEIENAIPFPTDNSKGVQTIFTLKPKAMASSLREVEAEWAVFSPGSTDATAAWRRNAWGCLRLVLCDTSDERSREVLPPRRAPVAELTAVNVDRFYSSLEDIGLGYSDLFRRINSIHRKLGLATVTISQVNDRLSANIHPALLDASFQSLFAAFCWPGDGSLSAPYVPTRFESLRILNKDTVQSTSEFRIDSYIGEARGQTITADLDVFDEDTGTALVQLQGFICTSLARPTAKDYKELYTNNIWELDISSSVADAERFQDSDDDLELVDLCERLSFFYLRELNTAIDRTIVPDLVWHHQRVFEWIDQLFPKIKSGQHPTMKPEWEADTRETLMPQLSRFADRVDVQLIMAVGEHLAAVMREETTMLEHMIQDDLLNRIYKFGLGFQRANGYMGHTIKQMTHRFPHMKVLEIGAGTGGATKGILEAIGHAFESYTFTDISTGFFMNAAELFAPWEDKIIFKALDIERDPLEQGYESRQYDLVVASNVLHATQSLAATMANVRKLIKPGGYLALLEVTSDIVRVKLMMSGLPGWWLGGNDGRRYAPTITVPQWDEVLRQSSFSGTDHVVNDFADESKYMTSVILSQAVDDTIQFLREPTTFQSPPGFTWADTPLTIVGGVSGDLSIHLRRILSMVPGEAPTVYHIPRLNDVATSVVPLTSVVLLEDLDKPVLLDLSQQQLSSLQKIAENFRHMLWVSRGCELESPDSNMSVGLCRALAAEHPHAHMQHLDLESGKDTVATAKSIANLVGRLVFTTSKKLDSQGGIMWTSERELRLKDGNLLIPRVFPDKPLNDRLNALRMPINEEKPSSGLRLSIQDGKFVTISQNELYRSPASQRSLKINIQYALIEPFEANGKHLYACCGSLAENGDSRVLALTNAIASVVDVPEDLVLELASRATSSSSALLQLTLGLLSSSILTKLDGSNDSVALYEPDSALGDTLAHDAVRQGISVSKLSHIPQEGVTTLHPYSADRQLVKLIPRSTKAIVDFSKDGLPPRMKNILPSGCSVLRPISLFAEFDGHNIPYRLWEAFRGVRHRHAVGSLPIPFTDVVGKKVGEISYHTMVEFPPDSVTAMPKAPLVEPVEYTKLFRADRTYLLAGCTGGLGQALCRWMITCGAKHIALLTRNMAKVSKTWLSELADLGGNVLLLGVDVSDKSALEDACKKVGARMPPIGGVANAAMVLSDRSFGESKLEDFNKVFSPKVKGTKNLNEIFHDNAELDFFIMFSSLASVVGNRGQSNYVAANLYMSTIAEQRRFRGLAASVLHIGMILGVGYVSSTGVYESTLRHYNYMAIPEREFLDMFAESIIVGKPDSGHCPEIIAGLSRHSVEECVSRPFWHEDSRFSHHTLAIQAKSEGKAAGNSKRSVSQRLAESNSSGEEVCTIIQEEFCRSLERMLQAAEGSIDPGQSLMRLGVDSLIAVEVRSWFVKELDIDLPVLKVLGGACAADLCNEAASHVLANIAKKEAPKESETVTEKKAEKPALEARSPVPCTETNMPTIQVVDHDTIDRHETSSSGHQSGSHASTPFTSQHPSPQLSPVVDVDKYGNLARPFERSGPMSYAQERLWFLRQYLADPTVHNVTLSYNIQGRLRLNDLENAIHVVIRKHEALRTCFYQDEETNEARQGILAEANFALERKTRGGVDEEFSAMRRHVFDLENGQILRLVAISPSKDQHSLVIGFNHIALDGYSAQILIKDLIAAYEGSALAPPRCQYLDAATNQRSETASKPEHLAYWKSQFQTTPPTLPLLDFSEVKTRRVLTDYTMRTVERRLSVLDSIQIKTAAQKLRATMFNIWLATYQVLLNRLMNLDDVCIGVVDANRTSSDILDTIGFFVNLIPMRFNLQSNERFQQVLANTKERSYAALTHSGVPFDQLLDLLHVPRSTSHSPLFQAALNVKLGTTQSMKLGDCEAEAIRFDDIGNAFDLNIEVEMLADGSTLLGIKSPKCLYTHDDLTTVLDTFIHLAKTFSASPDSEIGAALLCTPDELEKALTLGEGPDVTLPSPEFETLSHWFDHWATAQPSDVAIKSDRGVSLTYAEAARRVGRIASALLQSGIKRGDFVGVYCEPSPEVICTMLAIHRLGCSYVPLDLLNPVARLQLVVDDCKPSVIVYDDHTASDAKELKTSATLVNVSSTTSSAVGRHIKMQARGEDIACVLYTSGTTGTPKGVLLTHSNLEYHIAAVRRRNNLGKEIVLHQTSYSFDMSLTQIYHCIVGGGTLIVASRESRIDPAALAGLMVLESVTLIAMTPTMCSMMMTYGRKLLARCKTWRCALMGGEAMKKSLVDDVATLGLKGLRFVNTYGPTEITITSSSGGDEITAERSSKEPTLGTTYDNYTSYILGTDLKPVPIGFGGELCIAGSGIAAGYLGRPQQTADKFIPSPYCTPLFKQRGWTKLYRTGDRAKFLPDGQIVYLGRIDGDSQVKIRGFRIEMDDVARSLLRESGGLVSDAAVVVRRDDESGDDYLVAFVVLSSVRQKQPTEALLEAKRTKLPLPEYMIPERIVILDAMPLNSSGKLDRKALDKVQVQPRDVAASSTDTDLTRLEERLKELWLEVLPNIATAKIGRDTDFFAAGGNSILLLRLQGLVRQDIGAHVRVFDLFQASSLAAMAAKLSDNQDPEAREMIEWAEETKIDEKKCQTPSASTTSPDPGYADQGIEVVVTGSTGFLGSEIVSRLLKNPRASKIHCIAIRNLEDRRSTLYSDPKVVYYAGDLSSPRLGLSQSDFQALSRTTHRIIHNGATVNFLKSYSSLRASNVDSTRELAYLAAARHVPIHYISSAGVAGFTGKETLPPQSVKEFQPPNDGSHGYSATKWASEVVLEKVASAGGPDMQVTIHRPTSITGPNAPATDLMQNIIRQSLKMRALPNIQGWKGMLDFVGVDRVAEGVVDSLFAARQDAKEVPLQFVHHCGGKIPMEDLRECLEGENGVELASVGLEEWLGKAKEDGMDAMMEDVVREMLNAGDGAYMPSLE
ncbi:hypothetical protein MKZ38_005488 [Zalerion maritima]|uniref:Polyketide synthase n=1 Tax=Zalerion maritima TaxID=339359 RepID=A0AAD5WWK4_9PEZI|nr:hypothetical protein MKZ38_005488 [Zalerion maritima]